MKPIAAGDRISAPWGAAWTVVEAKDGALRLRLEADGAGMRTFDIEGITEGAVALLVKTQGFVVDQAVAA